MTYIAPKKTSLSNYGDQNIKLSKGGFGVVDPGTGSFEILEAIPATQVDELFTIAKAHGQAAQFLTSADVRVDGQNLSINPAEFIETIPALKEQRDEIRREMAKWILKFYGWLVPTATWDKHFYTEAGHVGQNPGVSFDSEMERTDTLTWEVNLHETGVSVDGPWEESLQSIANQVYPFIKVPGVKEAHDNLYAGKGISVGIIDAWERWHGAECGALVQSISPLASIHLVLNHPLDILLHSHKYDVMQASFYSSGYRTDVYNHIANVATNTVFCWAAGHSGNVDSDNACVIRKNYFLRSIYEPGWGLDNGYGEDLYNAPHFLLVGEYDSDRTVPGFTAIACGYRNMVFCRSTSVTVDSKGSNGNSYASPRAAGVAALLRSINPALPAGEIVTIMLETADRDFPEYDLRRHGMGLLNAGKAVERVLSTIQ